ncbi:MAG TPA: hypothetical protein VLH18_00080 [Candidatus Limnocylindrales bacterium]|nr:hypothetical protein [Candidatus Limnocylindrales bacterium]
MANLGKTGLIRLSEWLYRGVSTPVTVTAVIIFTLFILLVLPNMVGRLAEVAGVGVSPDTSFIYSAADLYAMTEAYGEVGRTYYIYQRFTLDLIWPLVYLFFFAALITFLYRRLPQQSWWRLLNLLPFAGVLFDLLENSAASMVMYRYPLPTPVIVQLTPIFTLAKWVTISLNFGAVLAGIYFFIKTRLAQNMSSGRSY